MGGGGSITGTRRTGLALLAALVLAVSAFTAWSGWSYARARGDDDLAYAKARDAVLDAGRRHIAVLQSMDADDVAAGVRRWEEAATGALADELERDRKQSTEALRQEGTTTRATVTAAAVTALDTRAGTARVIATVRVDVEPRGGETTTDRKRLEAGLARTGSEWRISSLKAVPVGSG